MPQPYPVIPTSVSALADVNKTKSIASSQEVTYYTYDKDPQAIIDSAHDEGIDVDSMTVNDARFALRVEMYGGVPK